MEKEHCCKVCNRVFHNGRALGGHMRSHLSLNSSSDADERGVYGYGLRENPKKSLRILDSDDNSQLRSEEEDEEEEDMNEIMEMVGKKRKKRRLRWVAAISTNSPSVSESEKEQEDGAMILMMLSRDLLPFDDESSRGSKRGVLANGHRRIASKNIESNFFHSGFVRDDHEFNNSEFDMTEKNNLKYGDEFEKGREFRCATCNKIFHSYQALGGHRASHIKLKGYISSSSKELSSSIKPASMEETIDGNLRTKALYGLKKQSKGHKCPVCHKVFTSGQALGGHKRSHFVLNSEICSPIDTKIPAFMDEGSNDTSGEF